MKKLRIGINGFGRIGRCLFRLGLEKLDIVAVNSRSSIEVASHLLKYDSVHGIYKKNISCMKDKIKIDEKQVAYCAYSHPSQIPWDQWNVDLVLECSGVFKERADLQAHFRKGVKRVFVSAPTKGDDFTLIYGVNQDVFNPEQHKIISNGSCTTNCLVPVIKVLDEHFKIQDLMFTTIHSYTQDQKLLDSSHKKDLRRARAAALSMIPTSTGATNALARIFPHLKGKIGGMAVRVPTANVSLVDLVFRPLMNTKTVGVQDVNSAFLSAEETNLKGVLACEKQELVSMDFNGNPYSCIVDLPSTIVLQEGLIKILAWYDNETGFSQRMMDFIVHLEKRER
ncbi:MAG: type I glyceraldehyde-3-phosphate dehydrogenase [Bdellovibrionales bacterium]|nr:type I glyceraldehyde-3-phosphate dehydrogenase [Bdellovibrionales bacterium]